MSNFKSLDDFQDESLTLPVRFLNGETRDVTISAPSAKNGLKVQTVMEAGLRVAAGGNADELVLDDDEELDFYKTALGDKYDELKAGCSWPWFRHIAITAVLWITQDKEAAENYWNSGGSPSQGAPNREARRQAGKAAAKSTPSRGSTSGTNHRKGGNPGRKALPK